MKGKQQKKSRVQRGNRSGIVAIPHPPAIHGLELRHSPTLRFRATSAFVLASITFQNLLDTMLVATTSIAGVQQFQTVRVRGIRIWGMPAIGAAASVYVEFSGVTAGSVGDQAIHTDTSMGIQPAFLAVAPNQKCLASNFQISSSATAFTVSGPAGAVIDLDLSFHGPTFGGPSAAVANALVGATPGAQYLRGMDGLATAASNFVPEFSFGQI